MQLGLQHVSLNAAAQMVLARVATNLGQNLARVLDTVAYDLCHAVPIYGLEIATQTYRLIRKEELRGALIENGARVLTSTDNARFTDLAVRRVDLDAHLSSLDRLDTGAWSEQEATPLVANAHA
jgi:hypothetical protein